MYTIFPESGHVNVSGIKHFHECDHVTLFFEQLFNTRVTSTFHIDNSTSTGTLANNVILPLDLTRLIGFDGHSLPYSCTISLRPHYVFPGVLIRPSRQTANIISTCILFRSGKFNIVGAKNQGQIQRTTVALQDIIQNVFGENGGVQSRDRR